MPKPPTREEMLDNLDDLHDGLSVYTLRKNFNAYADHLEQKVEGLERVAGEEATDTMELEIELYKEKQQTTRLREELRGMEVRALRWERDYQREVLNDILAIEEDHGLSLPPTLKKLKAEKVLRLDELEAELRNQEKGA